MNKLFSILILLLFPLMAWGANPSFFDTYGSNGVHTAVTGTGGSQKIAIGFQNGLGDFLANAPGILVNGGSGALSWASVSTTNLYNSDQFLVSTAGVVNIKSAALVTNLVDRVLLLVTNDSGAVASFIFGGTDAQGRGILKSVAGGIELNSAGTTTLRTTAGNGIGLNSGSFSVFLLDNLFYPSGSNTVSGGQTTTPFKDWFSKKFTLMGTDSTTNVLTATNGVLLVNGVPVGSSPWTDNGTVISAPVSDDYSRELSYANFSLDSFGTADAWNFIVEAANSTNAWWITVAKNGSPSRLFFTSDGTERLIFDGQNNRIDAGDYPINIGSESGLDQEVDTPNSNDILNLGRLSGVQQMITNSQGIISMGIGSGFLRTVIDSTNIVGLGADSFELSYFTNVNDFISVGQGGDTTFAYDSQRIVAISHESLGDAILHNANNLLFMNCFAGAHAELSDAGNFDVSGSQAAQYYFATNTTDVLAIGSLSADHATSDNSSDLAYIAKQAGYLSALTNSTSVMFLGGLAGANVFGTYSNVVFVGSGSTATTGASDKVILGPRMSISTGIPTGGSLAAIKLGALETGLTLTLNTTNAIRAEINGVKKYLMIANQTPP